MSEFWKKYEHPNWQKKRAAILTRDEYTCQECLDTEKQLHVHHRIYRRNCDPWDYADSELTTLCKDCHAEATDYSKALREAVAKLPPGEFQQVVGFAEGMVALQAWFDLGAASADLEFPAGKDRSFSLKTDSVAFGFFSALSEKTQYDAVKHFAKRGHFLLSEIHRLAHGTTLTDLSEGR